MNAQETMKNTQPSTPHRRSAAAVNGLVKTKFQPTESQRVLGTDAFSYYSNKFNLEKARQFKQDDVEVIQTSRTTSQGQGTVTKRRKGSKVHPIQVQANGGGGTRQTRISFEVYPDLFFNDENIRMLEQMDCADLSDVEDERSSEETSDDAGSTSKNERKRSAGEMLDELRSILDLYLAKVETTSSAKVSDDTE